MKLARIERILLISVFIIVAGLIMIIAGMYFKIPGYCSQGCREGMSYPFTNVEGGACNATATKSV